MESEKVVPIPYIPVGNAVEGKLVLEHEGTTFSFRGKTNPQRDWVWQSDTNPPEQRVFIAPEFRLMRVKIADLIPLEDLTD